MVVDVVEIGRVERGSPRGGPFMFDDGSRRCGHNSGTGPNRLLRSQSAPQLSRGVIMTTIRRFTPAIGFILASMSIVTSPMAAQRTDAATLCKIAQDSIAAGAFTSNATTGLLYCGSSAATVLSTLISQSGSSQDAGRFSLINRIAPQIRSQSIVNSALTVAQTVGNTQASRVASFQVLAAEFNNIFQFASPTPGAPIEACALSGSGGNSAYYYDEGLARSLGQQIMTLASAVYHNTMIRSFEARHTASGKHCIRTFLSRSTRR
jgi:hypothetical protein